MGIADAARGGKCRRVKHYKDGNCTKLYPKIALEFTEQQCDLQHTRSVHHDHRLNRRTKCKQGGWCAACMYTSRSEKLKRK